MNLLNIIISCDNRQLAENLQQKIFSVMAKHGSLVNYNHPFEFSLAEPGALLNYINQYPFMAVINFNGHLPQSVELYNKINRLITTDSPRADIIGFYDANNPQVTAVVAKGKFSAKYETQTLAEMEEKILNHIDLAYQKYEKLHEKELTEERRRISAADSLNSTIYSKL